MSVTVSKAASTLFAISRARHTAIHKDPPQSRSKMTQGLEKVIEQWCISQNSDELKIALESLELRQDGRRISQAARLQRWLLGDYSAADFLPSPSMSAGEARTKRERLRVAFIEHTSKEASGRSKCSTLRANDNADDVHPLVQLRRAMQANCTVEMQTDFSTPQSTVETEVDKWVLKLSIEEVNTVQKMLLLKTSDDYWSNIRHLKARLVGDNIWEDYVTAEELGRDVTQDERDARLLTFLELALPSVYKTVAARIAHNSGFENADEVCAHIFGESSQRPAENCETVTLRIDSVWGKEDSHHTMVDEKKRPNENADITSTTSETTLTLDSEITHSEELNSDSESQSTSELCSSCNELREGDPRTLTYTQLQDEVKRMRHQLRELQEKVRRLEKPETSQTESLLASVRQRRTSRANPCQETASASSTSQKSAIKKANEVRRNSPRKRPKGQSKEDARKSSPPSDGSRFDERKRKGELKPTVQKSHLPHKKRTQGGRDGDWHKKNQHSAKVNRTNEMTNDAQKHACKIEKRCWICKSRTHERRDCSEPNNAVTHMSKRARKRLECWTCGRMTHWWRDCPNAGDSDEEVRTSQAQDTRRSRRSDYESSRKSSSTTSNPKSVPNRSRRHETARTMEESLRGLPLHGTSLPDEESNVRTRLCSKQSKTREGNSIPSRSSKSPTTY